MADKTLSAFSEPIAGANPQAPLDMDAIRQLKELDSDDAPDFFHDLVREFQKEGAELMASIRNAIEKDDAIALRDAAHSLKGASATIGVIGLSASCGRICELARAGDLRSSAPLLPALESEWARAIQALQECTGENQ
jgi:two-component system, sensor histidine kinase and response regulator